MAQLDHQAVTTAVTILLALIHHALEYRPRRCSNCQQ